MPAAIRAESFGSIAPRFSTIVESDSPSTYCITMKWRPSA
jgi:hypothetical protein